MGFCLNSSYEVFRSKRAAYFFVRLLSLLLRRKSACFLDYKFVIPLAPAALPTPSTSLHNTCRCRRQKGKPPNPQTQNRNPNPNTREENEKREKDKRRHRGIASASPPFLPSRNHYALFKRRFKCIRIGVRCSVRQSTGTPKT